MVVVEEGKMTLIPTSQRSSSTVRPFKEATMAEADPCIDNNESMTVVSIPLLLLLLLLVTTCTSALIITSNSFFSLGAPSVLKMDAICDWSARAESLPVAILNIYHYQ